MGTVKRLGKIQWWWYPLTPMLGLNLEFGPRPTWLHLPFAIIGYYPRDTRRYGWAEAEAGIPHTTDRYEYLFAKDPLEIVKHWEPWENSRFFNFGLGYGKGRLTFYFWRYQVRVNLMDRKEPNADTTLSKTS